MTVRIGRGESITGAQSRHQIPSYPYVSLFAGEKVASNILTDALG
jgi:hypothetical protein